MSEKVDYTGQETVFKSYTAIRKAIFDNDFNTLKTAHETIPKPIHKEKALKSNAPKMVLIKDDPNILLSIQNNNDIINFAINCKGHRDLLAYIYIENTDFINFIIKNPNGYPLILTRIPVDDNYIISKAPNCCFDFPLKDIIQRDIKYTKKNTYNIIYTKNESELSSVQFKYELYNSDGTPNTSFTLQNIKINSLNIINNLFKLAKTDIKITDETQYINGFKALNIIVLKNVTDKPSLVVFTNRGTKNTLYKIQLTPTSMKFINENTRHSMSQELATADNSLIWSIDTEETFTMISFESMFKANFNKIYNQADRVYYIFGTFLGIYVFIKFISPINIKDPPKYRILNEIFDGKYQFYECYYLNKSN